MEMQTRKTLPPPPTHPSIIVTNVTERKDFSEYDYLAKIIVIGDSGVGKSSILKMLKELTFDNDPVSTVGIDFFTAYMQIEHNNKCTKNNQQKRRNNIINIIKNNNREDESDIGSGIRSEDRYLTISNTHGTIKKQIKKPVFKFQIWDCAGQERFRAIVNSYIRGANVVVYVFDITDKTSFKNLSEWKKNVEEHLGSVESNDYTTVVIGNKIDINTDRTVTQKEGVLFAEELNTFYAEVSAKSSTDITDLFKQITRSIYFKMLNGTLRIDHVSKYATPSVDVITLSTPLQDDDDEIIKCHNCNIA